MVFTINRSCLNFTSWDGSASEVVFLLEEICSAMRNSKEDSHQCWGSMIEAARCWILAQGMCAESCLWSHFPIMTLSTLDLWIPNDNARRDCTEPWESVWSRHGGPVWVGQDFPCFCFEFQRWFQGALYGDHCPQLAIDLYHVPSTVSFNCIRNFNFNLPSGPARQNVCSPPPQMNKLRWAGGVIHSSPQSKLMVNAGHDKKTSGSRPGGLPQKRQ